MSVGVRQRFDHIWFQRHLLLEFLSRDLHARYVGTVMGFFWSVIHPLILLGVFTVVFSLILPNEPTERMQARGWSDDTLGFAFYIFCGLLPWYAFQESLARNTTCIVDNAHLIKQVRFPAKLLPAYLTLSSLVNQLTGTLVFLVFQLVVLGSLSPTVLALVPLFVLEFVLFFGLGLLFSTLHTYIRDVSPLVAIGTFVMMWMTPMVYTMEAVPEALRGLLYLNPFTYLVLLHHEIMLYGSWGTVWMWGAVALLAGFFFAVGYLVFTRSHGTFADVL